MLREIQNVVLYGLTDDPFSAAGHKHCMAVVESRYYTVYWVFRFYMLKTAS